MSYMEQNAMETFIRREVENLFAQQFVAKATARARTSRTPTTFNAVAAPSVNVIPMELEDYDTDNMADITGAPTRLTIKTPGVYLFWGNALFQPPGVASYTQTFLRYNGSTTVMGSMLAESQGTANLGTTMDVRVCAVNDFVELVLQVSGAGPVTAATLGAVRLG